MEIKLKPRDKEDEFCSTSWIEASKLGSHYKTDEIMIDLKKVSYYYYHEEEKSNTLVFVVDGQRETFVGYTGSADDYIYKRLKYEEVKELAEKIKECIA